MRHATNAGFTLLEVLVAVALLALLGVAASATLHTSLQSGAQLDDRRQRLEALQLALTLLRRDLEQISLRPSRDTYLQSVDGPLLLSEPDASRDGTLVSFVRTGRRLIPGRSFGSSLERVRYRLQDERLLRDSSPILDPAEETQWHTRVVLDGVSRIHLRFYEGAEWSASWSQGQDGAPPFPQALSVNLDAAPWGELELLVLLPDASTVFSAEEGSQG